MRRHIFLLITIVINPIIVVAEKESSFQSGPLQSNMAAQLLILFGCIFILAAALGLIRFPDF